MITEAQRDRLIEAAVAVRELAYAPYSHYRVGAAILVADSRQPDSRQPDSRQPDDRWLDGRLITGVNVENASYGLTICAERTAVFKAVSEGFQEILAVVVATENAGSPCGACRQVLAEFAGDVPVWLVDGTGHGRETTLYTLLPDHFGPQHLTI